jgi:Mg2+-importing ATPase
MKLLKKEPRGGAKQPAVSARGEQTRQRLLFACEQEPDAVYDRLGTTPDGITEDRAEELRDEYGRNVLSRGKKPPLFKVIAGAFLNPFTIVLLALACVSLFTDVILAEPGSRNPMTVIIIAVMILLSGSLRLIQETKSGNAAARLSASILTTAGVQRAESGHVEIPMEELVVGDTIYLSAGDMVPADVRITAAKDLFVSQSSLTGESEPVEKTAAAVSAAQPSEAACLAFLGSTVVSGSATAIVLAVGDDTLLGELAQRLNVKPPKTSFEKGVNAVSWVLIRFMLVMVPVVLFLSGFTKGDWLNALLFAISVAVGLTPEMLPMIVTTCLARGAVAMSRHKVIIKSLNAIQNLGSIDILCTDKTGTLTQDQVVLEYHLDVNGREDDRVLRHAFLNSYFQTGLKNLMDLAILDHTKALDPVDGSYSRIISTYRKVDEIPFDFERRRMSVVVTDNAGKTQLITKGAIEEMLQISSFVEYDGTVAPLTAEMKRVVLAKADELNTGGMRVLGVAQKTNPSPIGAFSVKDESDMVLIGYLAFLDPPKKTAAAAIAALHACGVDVKVLTGDNEKVAACVCRQVGLKTDTMVLGSQLDRMSDRELSQVCERASVFAKLSPAQKARVVTLLRQNGHSVGYMGDGINDAAAMKASDVGISVDTAVDIAKESASVVLLEKDLLVLEEGILEGRRTYANMIKYIKMTASSNFGNMLSVLAASAFLPFLPMASVQLILLNMIYDFSCTLIPWDNVDAEYLKKPRQWSANSITRFMLRIGPTSSVFDLATYALMFFVICPAVCGGAYGTLSPAAQALFVSVFRTGWFVESMWTQALVVHMIRTEKVPFVQSRASRPLLYSTFCAIAVVTAIPFTPFGTALGLHALPAVYFACLLALVLGYMALATAAKKSYIRRYGELL